MIWLNKLMFSIFLIFIIYSNHVTTKTIGSTEIPTKLIPLWHWCTLQQQSVLVESIFVQLRQPPNNEHHDAHYTPTNDAWNRSPLGNTVIPTLHIKFRASERHSQGKSNKQSKLLLSIKHGNYLNKFKSLFRKYILD